jgi:bifunctional non-homologous end joining protein LigD
LQSDHPPPDTRLSRYREKRALDRTPEPAGSIPRGAGRLFVVHKHAARHLHFDLRLEMDGVLRSWAVPKGPSYDTADKRLAVLVEDHPIEYGDFEGVIPAGNYGAGGVILWDRGRWTPIGDPAEGMLKGKLLFRLDGYKLHGLWTLVKIKKGDKEWLLIKERDGYATPGGRPVPEGSVLSGRLVEDVKAGTDLETPLLAALPPREAPSRTVHAADVDLMLCETADKPFSRDGWVFELKLDGYRILAEKDGGLGRLRTRNGGDITAGFPEIVRSIAALPYSHAVIDGEIVVLDEAGKPSFGRLQQRARLRKPYDIRRAEVELPASFFAFDLLAIGPRDLRNLPLLRRKALLRQVVPVVGPVRYLDHVEREGERFFQEVERMGLEGLVAKRGDAPYRGGRSPAWLKLRAARTADLVVIGFTAPRGSRTAIGALHLGQYANGKLRYAGRVGSGFTDRELAALRIELERERRRAPPATGIPGDAKGSTWVEPRRVVEVRFTEWTKDGLLRQPVFVRWRDDKEPKECVAESDQAPPVTIDPPPVPRRRSRVAERPTVAISNPTKIYWPADGYTKADLVEYYRTISPWLLPYLRERPVVLTRYPDGIDGKSFYQKDAPESTPDWVRTEPIWSEDTAREIHYIVCDDLETLLFLANLGSIPLHLWGSRVGSLEKPDWCVIDLDPKEAPFTDVITIARHLHDLCEDAGLPNFVKTTGKSGLHVIIPLGRQCTWDEARSLGELLARMVLRTHGDITTITRTIEKRGRKVYLDYMQNRRGQLIAAPFCVRPLPGAPVSMPLEWREVNARLDPRRFTIRTAPPRMKKLGHDPLAPVLELTPDLHAALESLARRPAAAVHRGSKRAGRG